LVVEFKNKKKKEKNSIICFNLSQLRIPERAMQNYISKITLFKFGLMNFIILFR
jgi:hypothetical protein